MADFSYADANAGKADFEWTYNQLDPRAYHETLGAFDYAIPEVAAPIFQRIFDACSAEHDKEQLTAVDLGCSYGINAAVLKYGLSMRQLRAHYRRFAHDASPRDVLAADQKTFAQIQARGDLRVIGLDRAQFATSYAYWAGPLDDAIPENLEEADPSAQAVEALSACDVIISTGCVGYIGAPTFERIIACREPDDEPWIASFVLRMFDYEPIAERLAEKGFVTEKLDGAYFPQRRFVDEAEQAHVAQLLAARGLDGEGLESEGHYLAECFLSRPAADARAMPLTEIMG